MGNTDADGLTLLCGGQTSNVAVASSLTTLCGGQITMESLSPLYF
jgi:hypothetical protein